MIALIYRPGTHGVIRNAYYSVLEHRRLNEFVFGSSCSWDIARIRRRLGSVNMCDIVSRQIVQVRDAKQK